MQFCFVPFPPPRIRATTGNIYSLLCARTCSKCFLSIWSFHFYNHPTKVRIIIISVLQMGDWPRENKTTQPASGSIRTQAEDRLRNPMLSCTTSSCHFFGSFSAWTTPVQPSTSSEMPSLTPSRCLRMEGMGRLPDVLRAGCP